nr:RNA-dependent RNA polymerase [Oyster mushroom spherical virus]
MLKALENHRNVNTLPNYLRGKVTVLSMKPAKLAALRARCPGVQFNLVNEIITPADHTRFTDPAPAPDFQGPGDMILVDDALQHWSRSRIDAAFRHFGGSRLIGTNIHPDEVRSRLASRYPDLYTIDYLPDGRYGFCPTDNKSASYEASIDEAWMLDCRDFTVDDRTYDVEFLVSYGPYHLVTVVPADGHVVRTVRYFDAPEVVQLPDIPGLPSLTSPWFPALMYTQTLDHAGSLKQLGERDGKARIRGLRMTPEGRRIPFATWERLLTCAKLAGMHVDAEELTGLTAIGMDRIWYFIRRKAEEWLPTWLFELLYSQFVVARRVRQALRQDVILVKVPLRSLPSVPSAPWTSSGPPLPAPVVTPPPPPPPGPSNPPGGPPSGPSGPNGGPPGGPPNGRGSGGPPPPRTNARASSSSGPHVQSASTGASKQRRLNAAAAPPLNHAHPVRPNANPIPRVAASSVRPNFLGVLAADRCCPTISWKPAESNLACDPNSCYMAVATQILGTTDAANEILRRVVAALPADEVALLRPGGPGATQRFFHALGLIAGLRFDIVFHAPVPNDCLAQVGRLNGQAHVLHWSVQGTQGHWSRAVPALVSATGPTGPSPNPGPFISGAAAPHELFIQSVRDQGWQDFQFTPSLTNAKRLFNELEAEVTGKITKIDKWASCRKNMEMAARNGCTRPRTCVYLAGTAGCGKSSGVAGLVQQHGRLGYWLSVVSPLNDLNEEWTEKIVGLNSEQRKIFKTHEKAMFAQPQVVVFDEAQKLPGHYLDLYLAYHPDVELVILLGDPYQAGAPITDQRSLLFAEMSPGRTLARHAAYYLVDSWRVNPTVGQAWGIPVLHNTRSNVYWIRGINPDMPVIVSTVTAQNARRHYGEQAFTFSSCGGLDFPGYYQIVLTRELLSSVPEDAIYTAFTRSRHDIGVLNALSPQEFRTACNNSRLLNALFNGVPLNGTYRDVIGERTPGVPIVTGASLVSGTRLTTVADVLQGDDSKYDFLEPIMRASMLAPPPERVPSDVSPVPLTHAAPIDEWVPTYFGHSGHLKNDLNNTGFVRENHGFISPSGDMGRMFGSDRRPETADRVDGLNDFFPLHQSGDPALWGPTVPKRLRFGTEAGNRKELADSSFLGPMLCDAFRKSHNLPTDIPWDQELFDRCVEDCAAKRLSKSAEMLNNLTRDQDPILRDNKKVLNFLKGQLINKLDAITKATNAESVPTIKPAQMITTYTEEVNATFGPYTRYLAVKLREHSPDHVMHYGGMDLNDLGNWARKHVPQKRTKSFTNDYTAYDKSCRGETLAFEICIMRLFNVPEWIIELHTELTICVTSALGKLGIMRTSGQWCTYLFNTWYNDAYFTLKYVFPLSTPRGFSGDDMFILCVPTIAPGWFSISRYFSLVGKPIITFLPEFCGWLLTCHGIVRHPYLLLAKTLFHLGNGTLSNVLISYFMEFQHSLALGDSLWEVLPYDLLPYQGELQLIFNRHRSSIPSFLFRTNLLGDAPLPLLRSRFDLFKLPADFMRMDWRLLPSSIRRALLFAKGL